MINMPEVKIGIVAVSRDCFPESLSVNRRKALTEAYKKKYDASNLYECPICIVESELHMVQALEDVKTEIVSIASLMAGKAVAASMDVKLQDSLIQETLKEMGESTWQS